MKKLIIVLLILPLLLKAQIRIKQNRDLNFGQLYPGESKSILLPTNCTDADSNTNLGKVQFDHTRKNKNDTVTVSWTTPDVLSDGAGNIINFTNQEGWCADSTTGTVQDITDWGSGDYTGLGTANKYHNMYFGGSIDIPVNMVPGTYSGTISITLTY